MIQRQPGDPRDPLVKSNRIDGACSMIQKIQVRTESTPDRYMRMILLALRGIRVSGGFSPPPSLTSQRLSSNIQHQTNI